VFDDLTDQGHCIFHRELKTDSVSDVYIAGVFYNWQQRLQSTSTSQIFIGQDSLAVGTAGKSPHVARLVRFAADTIPRVKGPT
jgi:hypothetical protein